MGLRQINRLVFLSLAVAVHLFCGVGNAGDGRNIEISATPVPLDEEDPKRNSIGSVTYAGGWALSSPDDSFGGFSGITMVPEQKKMVAISDKGVWLAATFDAQSGMPPNDARLTEYAGLEDDEKFLKDSESVIRWDDGYAVSFEFEHRVEWVPNIGEAGKLLPEAVHIDFYGWAKNGGAEAIVRLKDGKLLTFSERGKNVKGLMQAWLSDAQSAERIFLKPPRNFSPTDAALLPNGDLLLLMRRFSPIDGVAAKVLHIKRPDITPGAILTGTEILHLTPKVTVDNMEGLSLVPINENSVRLVMISDDNFLPLQRTLLLMFDYQYQ